MDKNTNVAVQVLAVVGMTMAAQAAMGQTIDFDGAEDAGNQIIGFLRGPLATIVLVLGFAITGFLAAFNRISWLWCGGIILGAFFIFAGPAIVDSLRTIFS